MADRLFQLALRELFNKSLTIEEDAQFEGTSRRLDRPVEAPSNDQVNEDAPMISAAPKTAPEFDSVA